MHKDNIECSTALELTITNLEMVHITKIAKFLIHNYREVKRYIETINATVNIVYIHTSTRCRTTVTIVFANFMPFYAIMKVWQHDDGKVQTVACKNFK